jgi:hypothetical protein
VCSGGGGGATSVCGLTLLALQEAERRHRECVAEEAEAALLVFDALRY